ncbi:MAG TPA: DUF5670 family protein [Candidatus Acidoferrales bacterium]|jgi:hypothetical protein|nr:DUF5670 family protein [Candidatus Acidoferrales bacterium]
MSKEAHLRYIFLGFAILFIFIWALAFIAFHVASLLIHLFLILAVIFFIVHLLRPRRVA